MKRRFTLFLMAFVAMGMLMTGCKQGNANLILGTWTMDVEKSYEHYLLDGQEETHYMNEEMPEGLSVVVTFNDDGTVTEKINVGESMDEGTIDYLLTDEKLTMDGEIYTIEELTKKRLVLTQSIDDGKNVYTPHLVFTR